MQIVSELAANPVVMPAEEPLVTLHPTAYLRWRGPELEQLWATSTGVKRWATVPHCDVTGQTPSNDKAMPDHSRPPYVECGLLSFPLVLGIG
jgi:hypothetical protein